MWNPDGCKTYAAMKAKAAAEATAKQKAQPAPKTGTK